MDQEQPVVIDDDDDDDSVDEDDQEDVVDVVEDVEVMSRDRMLPSRINRVQSGPSKFGPANVMQQIFNLEQIPHMTQVRHLWACVGNVVGGDKKKNADGNPRMTSSEIGATKMGH
jgi:hypothetical protein